MKAEKINEIIEWAKQEDINPDSMYDCRRMYSQVSEELLEDELAFDVCAEDGGDYLICTTYVNIPGKEWFSAVVSRDVNWWWDTPENFAHYVAKLYERAMEIQSYFNS